jgi:hypothetical protein
VPFTPYHFGPSGFIGLIANRWIDLPVFVLANVVVDVEVLVVSAFWGWPMHRYLHTFLIGSAVGALWGLGAYLFRGLFSRIMRIFFLPYKTSLLKMIISGALGAAFHVFVDAIYHYDVAAFWPWKPRPTRPLWRLLSQEQVVLACEVFIGLSFLLYIFISGRELIKKRRKGPDKQPAKSKI